MKEIPLTQGLMAKVDDEDFERVNHQKWHVKKERDGQFDAICGRKKGGKQKYILMSHDILKGYRKKRLHLAIMESYKPIVRHLNGNRLDNRKENLKICSRREMAHYSRPDRECTSVYKGVSWYSYGGKWKMQITTGDNTRELWYFNSEKEAAQAYNKSAQWHFGERTYLNNI